MDAWIFVATVAAAATLLFAHQPPDIRIRRRVQAVPSLALVRAMRRRR